MLSKGSCDLQYKMPVAHATTCHEVLSHANHSVPTITRTLLNSKARYGFLASQQAQKPPEHTMPAVEQSLNLTNALCSLRLLRLALAGCTVIQLDAHQGTLHACTICCNTRSSTWHHISALAENTKLLQAHSIQTQICRVLFTFPNCACPAGFMLSTDSSSGPAESVLSGCCLHSQDNECLLYQIAIVLSQHFIVHYQLHAI